MKKINLALTDFLDFPIQINPDAFGDNPLNYYIDLTASFRVFPFTNIVFDKEGFPMYDYSNFSPPNNIGRQYSCILMGWYAIVYLENYLKTKEEVFKERFLRQAGWFVENKKIHKEDAFVWVNNYDWYDHSTFVTSPWISCMAQGFAISVLVRACRMTQDEGLLDIAKKAARVFAWDIKDGGVRFTQNGYAYYDMYPARPYSKILDGFVFGLMGLYDLYTATKDQDALRLFQEGARTITDNIGYWDFLGVWSKYGRHRYICWKMYHRLNYCWIGVLAEITHAKRLLEIHRRWDLQAMGILKKIIVLISFFITTRINNIKTVLMLKIQGKI